MMYSAVFEQRDSRLPRLASRAAFGTSKPPSSRSRTTVTTDSLSAARTHLVHKQRTLTWPSVRYRLWLEASDLPFYTIAERPAVRDKQRSKPHKKRQSCEGNNIRTLPNVSRKDRNTLKGDLNSPKTHPHAEATILPTLSSTLTVHRTVRPNESLSNQKAAQNSIDRFFTFSTPRSAHTPRLPSRMGRNSLDFFINTYQRDCQSISGVHCQLLQLNTLTRAPQDQKESLPSRERLQSEEVLRTRGSRKTCIYRRVEAARLSDVSPPHSPPNLVPAYRVKA